MKKTDARPDSNPRPTECQADALPTELPDKIEWIISLIEFLAEFAKNAPQIVIFEYIFELISLLYTNKFVRAEINNAPDAF